LPWSSAPAIADERRDDNPACGEKSTPVSHHVPAEEPNPRAFPVSAGRTKDVIEEDERVDIKTVGGFRCTSCSSGENIVEVMLYDVLL
jgi:hypothetical protein